MLFTLEDNIYGPTQETAETETAIGTRQETETVECLLTHCMQEGETAECLLTHDEDHIEHNVHKPFRVTPKK